MVVYLVGAGPGDADLITLKAIKALNKADVVLYDYLANDEILEHAPKDAKKIYIGKKAENIIKHKTKLIKLIVEQAKEMTLLFVLKEEILLFLVVEEKKY